MVRAADQSRHVVEDQSQRVTERVGSLVDKGKEVANQQKEQIVSAFEAGRQAYREERQKGETDDASSEK